MMTTILLLVGFVAVGIGLMAATATLLFGPDLKETARSRAAVAHAAEFSRRAA
jgi:hypothetical protein